jgi:microcystin-dependent protein
MNFQGQVLNPDGSPVATGDYALTFRVFDAAEGGNVIWGPQLFDGAGGPGHGPRIPVVQGYFNVMLGPEDTAARPLSGAFAGATRFLEIKVGTNNPIAPRQQILSAPYALSAANAATASTVGAGGVGGSAILDGAVNASKLTDGAVTAAKLADANVSVSKLAQEVIDRLVPPGSIVAFGGAIAPPGWAICDGSIRNGTDPAFAALFGVIAKTYGIGDGGATSFQLPDLRGRAAIGAGQSPGLTARALAAKPGTELITQVPSHSHSVNLTTSSAGAHSHSFDGWSASGGSVRFVDTAIASSTTTYTTSTAGAHTHSVSGVTGATGVSGVDNLPPSLVLNYIIKL